MAGIQWRVVVIGVFGLLGSACAFGDGGLLADDSDSADEALSAIDADSSSRASSNEEETTTSDVTTSKDDAEETTAESAAEPAAGEGDVEALKGPMVLLGSWQAGDVPHPVSDLETCGNTVLYESLPGDQLEVVGLDARDGSVLHRHEVNRGFILPGQHGAIRMNCDAGQFYTLNSEDRVEARTIDTGELIWTSDVSANTFDICGAKLCVSRFDGQNIDVLNATTGELDANYRVTDTRVLAGDDSGFRLRPNADSPDRGVTELIASRYDEELWRMGAKTIRDVVGHRFTPSTGWWALETGDPTSQTQYLGPTFDETANPEDRVTNGGVLFSYKIESGELLWAQGDMVGCFYPEEIFCHYAGYDGGRYKIDYILRIDPATGDTLWKHNVPEWPIMTRHGNHISIDFPEASNEARQWLDFTTGASLSDTPDLPYVTCQTFGDLPEGVDQLEAYSESTDAIIRWSPVEFAYPCENDDGPIVSGETIAATPELLHRDVARTDDDWIVIFDGEQLRGYQLG